jgi:SecD/SecF fusion protein
MFVDSTLLFAISEVTAGMLLVIAAVGLAFGLGNFLAKSLQLKDLAGKMTGVLAAILVSLIFFIYPYVRASIQQSNYTADLVAWEEKVEKGEKPTTPKPVPPKEGDKDHRWRESFRLGIDLAGGTNLVYQVDRAALEKMNEGVANNEQKVVSGVTMDKLVGAIGRRINPGGTEEVTVRQVGSDRIEIIIPGADRDVVEQKKREIVDLGSLEFGILANRIDHAGLIADGLALPPEKSTVIKNLRVVARWFPEGNTEDGEPKNVHKDGDVATRVVARDGKNVTEFLVAFDPRDPRVTGEFLSSAGRTNDENGDPAVSFTFNQAGGFRFTNLTSRNSPTKGGSATGSFFRRLAVILNNEIHSAPSINETIGSQGRITMGRGASLKEVDGLINVLNAGALELPLVRDPVSESTIGPTLAADVQEKGVMAILIASAAVLVFMLIYYRFAGIVADLCLMVNILLVMGTMAFIQATFTLPGLAGIVLTIGMAVDANVLIFERIREETAKGSSLRMAIHNGFGRAFTTIVDANVTTLIVAVVLYIIGTDQVRGFAVTLFIGIVMSMFTALYLGRLIFDVCERKRWISKLNMMSIVGTTNWDFLGKRKLAGMVSGVLILAGMVTLFSRGKDNLDIDFRGGTMITIEFVEPQTLTNVKNVLAKNETLASGLTVESLLTLEESDQGVTEVKQFRVRTTNQNVAKVRKALSSELSAADNMDLVLVTVTYTDIDEVPSNDAADDAGDDAEAKAKPVKLSAADAGFAGGSKSVLTFSSPVAIDTITRYLGDQLGAIPRDPSKKADKDNRKYESPALFFDLTGSKGPGMKAQTGQVPRFTEVELRAPAEAGLAADLTDSLAKMQATMASDPIFEEVNSFAAAVAAEMRDSAILAMIISLISIVAYIWFRFQRVTFGLAAVAALVHDVLVVLGLVALAAYASGTPLGSIFALDDFKINLPMIAAFMTIVGYSLNDTIVVFDRIREVRGKNPALTEEMVNKSLNQTLARTLLTSATTLIVVAILYVIGGEGIHGFAFCLVMGVLVGTYSSIYVASPVLLYLMNREGSAAGLATTAAEQQRAAAR